MSNSAVSGSQLTAWLFAMTISWFVLAAPVSKEEVWVRPVGNQYGTGSGEDYDNAIAGFRRIPWGRIAGGTVWVCGLHRNTLVIAAERVEIRLDCAQEPGAIYGSNSIPAKKWREDVPDAHYSARVLRRPKVVAIDNVIQRETRLDLLRPGYFSVSGGGGGSFYRVHIALSPSGRDVEVGQRAYGIQIGADERDDIRTLKVTGGGSGRISFVGAGTSEHPQGKGIAAGSDVWTVPPGERRWEITGVKFFGIQEQAIHTYGTTAPHELIVRDCSIQAIGGEGIYAKGVTGVAIIENNVFGSRSSADFGWAGDGSSFAGDAIDLGGSPQDVSRRAIIRNNKITNVRGSGIAVNAGEALIENNRVRDAYIKTGSEDKACFRLDPQNALGLVALRRNECRTTFGSALIVRGNVKTAGPVSVDANIFVTEDPDKPVVSHPSANAKNISYRHNTVVGTIAIEFSERAQQLKRFSFENNLVVASYALIVPNGFDAGTTRFRNNNFWAHDRADAIIRIGRNEGAARHLIGQLAAPGERHLFADPEFESAETLRPLPTAAIVGAGAHLENLQTDRHGRPYAESPTIGAVEVLP